MRVACAQMRSTANVAQNLEHVALQARRAAAEGATLVATPENTTFLGPSVQKLKIAEPVDGPTNHALSEIARNERVWLLVGSVAERCERQDRCYNTSLLYDAEGHLRAMYRKIHLFDVDIPGGPSFQESAFVQPGSAPVVAESPIGMLGLSICFDLRFPVLYRDLVAAGATVLTVPSAFTVPTGEAHWHLLLRARAVESQAFVLAPAQEGRHDAAGLRESYGHSLIVDPWGRVLADAGRANPDGLAIADLDLSAVAQVRAGMPLRSPLWSAPAGRARAGSAP
jgi:predicted amidohydrolase